MVHHNAPPFVFASQGHKKGRDAQNIPALKRYGYVPAPAVLFLLGFSAVKTAALRHDAQHSQQDQVHAQQVDDGTSHHALRFSEG